MRKIVTTIGILALGSLPTFAATNKTVDLKKTVHLSSQVKVSKPLRDIAKPIPAITAQRKLKMQQSGEKIPGVDDVRIIPNRFNTKQQPMPENFVDSVHQNALPKKSPAALVPDLGVSFDGVGNVMGVAPPDTNGDVGPNHYVQAVNLSLAVFDKQGNTLLGPVATNSLWAGFGGLCESNNNGDPIVLYDSAADRWLISQFALSSGDNHECVAISTTGDPTGSYYLYDFPYGTAMNDYPHLGVWSNGYFMGVNQFDTASGGGVVAYERDKMLVGAPAQQVIFSLEDLGIFNVNAPLPLDIDGILPPPADMNNYFVWFDRVTNDSIHVYEFDIDWNDAASASFNEVANVQVAQFFQPAVVTQPNGAFLDSIDERPMFRAAYRNMGDMGKIVVTHNVGAPAGAGEAALRWYELNVDNTDGSVTVQNQGTFAPDTDSRWMGSAAMDVNGNIGIGYSIASSNKVPSINGATRLATDPANTLTDEFELHAGGGSQAQINRGRWGDYSSMSIDPVDDCTFWYTTEYYKAEDSDTVNWSTRIASFKIPTCTAGPRGDVAGTVTSSETGEPIANTRISLGLITTTTDEDGQYLITLPVGDYDVTASRYGWIESAPVTVTIPEEDTVTQDIVLDTAPVAVVSGNVSDINTDNPLYAQVVVSVPGDTLITYSNPETGDYAISLFEGTTVQFTTNEIGGGGYLSATADILPVNDPAPITEADFELSPNSNCTAAGYEPFNILSYYEGFDVFPATGWTVVDDDGSGVVWSSYLSSGRSLTGIETDAAFVDSDAGGTVSVDSSLVSPVLNVADLSTTVLQFEAFFRTFTGADKLDVDVSVDGGAWANVATVSALNRLETESVDLANEITGATSFQIRFRYYDAFFEWYAAIDNVRFDFQGCAPIAGSLVSGYVVDTNTLLPVNGALVSVDGVATANSIATTNDESLNDGFFQLFVADGARVEVSKDNYVSATDVENIALASPISLDAGQLEVDVASVDMSMTAGRSGSEDISVTNTGSAAAEFDSYFVKGDATQVINGPFHPSGRHFGPKNLEDYTAKAIRYFPEHDIEPLAPGEIVGFFPTGITYGWGISQNRATGEFWVGDLAAAGAPVDALFKYDSAGTLTGDSIEIDFVEVGGFFADSAYNQRTGMLWVVNVGSDTCIHEVDTDTMAVTGNTICPAFGVSQRGLAYDPITDTFYAGSWNDSIIHQFTTDGEILRSVNVGLAIAGLAYNAETQHLFISVNGASSAGEFDVVVVDAASPDMVKIGGYDVRLDVDGDGIPDDVINDNGQAGLDMDCDGNLWIVEQNQQFVVGFESGETGACEWNNVPWLSVSETSASLDVDEESQITANFDSTGLTAGTYSASIVYGNNTPYGTLTLPVTMELTEPQYGSTEFTVTSIVVDENDVANITVERSGGGDYAVSVDFQTIDGSAVVATDYVGQQGTLEWADMDTAAKTISVTTNLVDENKTFSVLLSNPQGGATLGAKSVASVTIKDKPKGSGSFGIPLIFLMALVAFARRKQIKK